MLGYLANTSLLTRIPLLWSEHTAISNQANSVSPMISKLMSDISSDKEHFDKAAPIYDVLKNSGFNEALKFCQQSLKDVIDEQTLLGSTCHSVVMLNKCRKTIFNPLKEAFPMVSQVLSYLIKVT